MRVEHKKKTFFIPLNDIYALDSAHTVNGATTRMSQKRKKKTPAYRTLNLSQMNHIPCKMHDSEHFFLFSTINYKINRRLKILWPPVIYSMHKKETHFEINVAWGFIKLKTAYTQNAHEFKIQLAKNQLFTTAIFF